jgi:hypothetical protein
MTSTDPALPADPAADAAGPGAPIPYTLTPQAEAYLDGLQAEAPDPEPEVSL